MVQPQLVRARKQSRADSLTVLVCDRLPSSCGYSSRLQTGCTSRVLRGESSCQTQRTSHPRWGPHFLWTAGNSLTVCASASRRASLWSGPSQQSGKNPVCTSPALTRLCSIIRGIDYPCGPTPLQGLLTLFPECFSPFDHSTCALSAPQPYSAFGRIHPQNFEQQCQASLLLDRGNSQ